jgi:general L-amino acid transport system permease protein
MTTTALEAATQEIRPPAASGGVIKRRLGPFFGTPINAVITLICIFAMGYFAVGVFRWAVLDAVAVGDAEACKAATGACWPFVMTKFRFMVFGFFPYGEHWRPALAMLLFLGACGVSMSPRNWTRKLLWFWGAIIVAIGILMYGGVFGLRVVPTTQWGGLPLSFMLSFLGLALGFPLGVILALARLSKLPAIRIMAIVFIEVVRGVPLISILFMATVMLPLFMPDGVTIDKLLRAHVAIIIFAAAYIAEVVRGGLQAIPKGQYEACDSMGLGYWQAMRLVILPQSLKIVIPPLVTIFIGFFQDTTLVTIIGLLDFLDTVRGAMRDPDWQGIAVLEGYVFAATIYLVFSYGMGAYSRFLEKHLRREHK